jgi:arylsulfatase A-like enzyme
MQKKYGETEHKMKVIFLDIDTLRHDHLGCYGYKRNTSPNIDSIAAEGVRFDNYYCPNAPCLPSRASLITGQFGIRTGVVGHGGTAADLRPQGESRGFTDLYSENSLFMQFRRGGYRTASVSSFAERHSSWWFNS